MKVTSLKNQLLVSMPQLTTPSFHQTVSLICQHDANGAIGVIVNRLTEHCLGDIFEQLALPISSLEHTGQPVFEGGPVNPELGLVIHASEESGKAILDKPDSAKQNADKQISAKQSPDKQPLGKVKKHHWESSMEIGGGLWLTSSRDILGAIADGRGPTNAMMILGYAGWGPGQLELEIRQNSWFHTPADHSIIFNTEIDQKWRQAAQLLGIDYAQLSTEVGHA